MCVRKLMPEVCVSCGPDRVKMKMANEPVPIIRRNRPGTKSKDPKHLHRFLRMSGETFDDLLHLVGPSLCKQNTNYKDSISAEERLAVTLRFLAQGGCYSSMFFLFRIPVATLAYLIPETCSVIYHALTDKYLKEWCNWEDESFEEMDSTLAVQQFIQQAIRKDFTNVEEILNPPDGQDEGVWKYEHLRQFCMELNGLAVKLQAECNPETCTQMTATEQWIFLCAAHKTPKECPAIDYTRHTLDGAACLLNSNKYFPSRVSIKDSSVAKLGSVCRRVYRIFSHAFFHHRILFDQYENETYLCRRFTQFVTKYNLMSKDNLIVPIMEDQQTLEGESEA